MQDLGWTLLIASHAIAASLAMVVGVLNIVRRRRGDRPHRVIGRAWAGLMYFVAIGSFWIQEPKPGEFSWIHGLSALTIVTLTLALWNARRGNIRGHAANMIGTYCGLLGAFIGVIAVPTRLVPESFQHDWLGMVQISGMIVIAGVAAVYAVTKLLPEKMDRRQEVKEKFDAESPSVGDHPSGSY